MAKSRIVALVVALPVLIIALTAVGVYGFVQTDAGRQFVARQLEAAVDDGQGLSLKLGRIGGNLFSDFTIKTISLQDAKGEWLTADNILLSWRPIDLLGGVLQVNVISLQAVNFSRLPVLPTTQDPKKSAGFQGLPVDIALDKLLVKKLRLGEPVLGRETQLRVAMVAHAEIGGVIHSDLDISELDAAAGSVKGSVEYHPVERTLSIDIKLDEPEGGLIARALEIPGYPQVTASFAGAGAINSWRGQLRASVEGFFDGEMAINTRGEDVIEIELNGGGQFDEDCVASIPLVDASRIGIDAAISWDIANRVIILRSSRLENKILGISGTGQLDLGKLSFKAALKTEARDADAVNEVIAPTAVKSAVLDLDVVGNFQEITANAILQAGMVTLAEDLTATEVTGTFTSKLDLDDLKVIPVTGSAAIVGLDGLPTEAKALLGPDLDLDFNATYTVASDYLRVDTARVTGAHGSAEAAGGYALQTGVVTAAATVSVADLSLVAPMDGKVSAKLKLQSQDISQGFQGSVDATATELAMTEKALQGVIGTDAKLTTDITFANEALDLSHISLLSGDVAVTGDATFPASFESLTSTFDVTLSSLAGLSQLAGADIAGAAALNAELSGALSDPAIKGKLTVNALQVDKKKLGELSADFTANNLITGPAGNVEGQLAHSQRTALYKTAFSLPDYRRLDLTDLSVTEKDNSLEGAVTIPFDGAPLTGKLTGTIPDVGAVAALMEEQASGSLDFAAALLDRAGKQSLSLDLKGKNLTFASAGVGIETLTITSTTEGANDAPDVTAKLVATGILVQDFPLKQVTLTGQGSLQQADFTFDIESGSDPDLQLNGAGQLTLGETATQLAISRLGGAFAGREIAMNRPISFRQSGNDLELDVFDIRLGKGAISGSANIGEAAATADIKISTLPLDLLELVDPALTLSGLLDGSVSLSITSAGESSGKMSFSASEIRMADAAYDNLPTLASRLSATLSKGQLDFDGDISGLDNTDMTATGSLPINLALAPFEVSVNKNKPVNIKIDINSNISSLWPLLALDTHILSGQLTANGRMSGSLAMPKIDGTATLAAGRYENVENGTILNKLMLDASIKDTETVRLKASAVDGKGGSMTSEGVITLASLSDPAVDLTIALNRFRVVDKDEIDVTTDANIGIKGQLSSLNITGDVTTQEVDINIGGALAANVVDLKVTEINRPGAVTTKEDVGSAIERTTHLNLALALPKRVFIRGRGLDSEWEGKFTVKGTVESPVIEGYLKPVRGQFTFAGKAFILQSGEISLLGGADLDPELDLSAQYEATNITALVSIQGTASDPTISFSSNDGRPEDEVLSQVLFGKSSGRLSALEAVQLAGAIASISGKFGSGGGIMGFMRDTLGVDVISAGTDAETGKAEVSVGKYVSDNIYVGVDQGAEAGTTRAKVQIDLTPNISVETEMGQSSDSSVGIFWKWDY